MGWLRLKDKIVPKLMSLAPVPETYDEVVNCDCESRREYKKRSEVIFAVCRLPSAVNVMLQLSNERNCRLQRFFLASKTYVNLLLYTIVDRGDWL